ncbi:cation transporter [Salinisphaera orenii MK-B5]|uniref:Cation transporter n=1 Tax=Salinisphaera orenii MK-B5 TaxID=856730 RepID=A0A423PUF8_9GAMM|nr:cation diffusion facilitator family transporter [Salinisphaera orenii]ROO29191.1 cation transporter [Salinisphaera orenii MK-B5]
MASGSRTVIYAALAGNLLIAITKFIAAAFTGSAAMMAEGIHSTVDTGNQGLLLYGMKRAKQPADARFPFGYGKEVYFWSFMVAVLIFAVGAGISIYEGVSRLLHPHPVESPLINYVVLGLAMLFEGAAWFVAARQFNRVRGKWGPFEAVRRGKDPGAFLVLFEDSAAMLGLIVAFAALLAGQLTGIPQFDGLASICIGLILAVTAVWLAIETKGLLIGEAANQHVVRDIRALVARDPAVERVNEVLTMHVGPEFILVNISVRFAPGLSGEQIQAATQGMDRAIKAECEHVERVFIEAEREADGPTEAGADGATGDAAKPTDPATR